MALQEPLARALVSTVWITEKTFLSELESLPRLASPKRRMTASSTNAGILPIYSFMVFSNLVDDAERVGCIVEAGRFSDTSVSVKLISVSSHSAHGTVVATYSKAAFYNWGEVGKFPMGVARFDARAVRKLWRSTCPRLRTMVSSSSHLPRLEFIDAKFAKAKV